MRSRSTYKIHTANLNRCIKLQKLNITLLNHITLNIKIFTLKFFTLYLVFIFTTYLEIIAMNGCDLIDLKYRLELA